MLMSNNAPATAFKDAVTTDVENECAANDPEVESLNWRDDPNRGQELLRLREITEKQYVESGLPRGPYACDYF